MGSLGDAVMGSLNVELDLGSGRSEIEKDGSRAWFIEVRDRGGFGRQ